MLTYRCELCHELVAGTDDDVLACPQHPHAGVMSCPVVDPEVVEAIDALGDDAADVYAQR